MESFIISPEQLNTLLSVLWELHRLPIYIKTFNNGIIFKVAGIEKRGYYFQLEYFCDESITLQLNDNGNVIYLGNADKSRIHKLVNAIIAYELKA